MEKNFDRWNEEKKKIHAAGTAEFYHEREVWWCALGVNVGDEQDGTGKNFDRPVLVVKGFNRRVFLGVALTGKKKEGKYYFYLGQIDGHDSTVVLSQVRIIDTKRLVRKVATINENMFRKVTEALRMVLFN